MTNRINSIIGLTLKNSSVALALAQMLPDGDLTYYTLERTPSESRDEALKPLWEKLNLADHPLPFNYDQWWKALHKVALPCVILNDIDAL